VFEWSELCEDAPAYKNDVKLTDKILGKFYIKEKK
jgi:hypothetical protein